MRPRRQPLWCTICGVRKTKRRNRCGTCSEYLRRHGCERPEAWIIRDGERFIERMAGA